MTRRRRRSVRGTRTTLGLAGIAVVLIGAATWLAVTAPKRLPWRTYYDLEVQLADVSNLADHSEVRIAGVRVGQVLDPRFEHGRSVATLRLNRDVEPLRAETRALIRSKGLLGQRYLALIPASRGRVLRSGDTIPVSRTAATVTLHEAISALDARHRADLQASVRGLAGGLAGRGMQVNRTLQIGAPFLRDVTAVADAVLARPGAARRIVPSAESAARAIDGARAELAALLEPTARALRPFTDRRPALQRALSLAPGTLADVRSGLARTDPLLEQVRRLALAANALLPAAPQALARTRSLLAATPRPLRATTALLRTARSSVPATIRLARRALPQLPGVDAALVTSLPLLDGLGEHSCDVLGWARNWRSMLGYGTPGGGKIGPLNVLRLALVASPGSVGGMKQPVVKPPNGTNAYPKPCEAGTEALP